MNRAYHEATITVLASILFLIVPARGWGVEQHYVVDGTQSHITFAAHSTGHNFQGQSSQISGRFGYEAQRIAESGAGEVHIPIRSIQTGISARDSRMYQSFDADHFPDRAIEIARLDRLDADGAIGFGQLDEIRQRFGVGMRKPVAVQKLLPLPDHSHVLVVQDEDLDR